AFRSGTPGETLYAIVEGGRQRRLEAAQWADWDAEGRLLVATEEGRLQIRDGADAATVAWEHDLSSLSPAPTPPPEEAKQCQCIRRPDGHRSLRPPRSPQRRARRALREPPAPAREVRRGGVPRVSPRRASRDAARDGAGAGYLPGGRHAAHATHSA